MPQIHEGKEGKHSKKFEMKEKSYKDGNGWSIHDMRPDGRKQNKHISQREKDHKQKNNHKHKHTNRKAHTNNVLQTLYLCRLCCTLILIRPL